MRTINRSGPHHGDIIARSRGAIIGYSLGVRLFVGIELSGSAKDMILATRGKLVEAISRQGVRFVNQDKLHVTLAFLGQVDAEAVASLKEALVAASSSTSPFDVTTAELGCFPDSHRPKVIWIGLGGATDALAELSEKVKTAAKSHAPELDEKPFAAHVTLARVSPGSKIVGTIVRHLPIEPGGGEMRVEAFALFHSKPDGTYEVLQRFEFATE